LGTYDDQFPLEWGACETAGLETNGLPQKGEEANRRTNNIFVQFDAGSAPKEEHHYLKGSKWKFN